MTIISSRIVSRIKILWNVSNFLRREHYVVELTRTEQKVLQRHNPPTFLALFNSKLDTLQRHDITDDYRILHIVVQCLSYHNLKILHRHHI
jgi:hypothetical protein